METNTTKASPAFSGDAFEDIADSKAPDDFDNTSQHRKTQADKRSTKERSARDAAQAVRRLHAEYLLQAIDGLIRRLEVAERLIQNGDTSVAIDQLRAGWLFWRAIRETCLKLRPAAVTRKAEGAR